VSVHYDAADVMNSTIFRAYDIRGKAHRDITAETCTLIGKGFGSIVREIEKDDHPLIIVGRDARTHSLEFETAVIEGLQKTGCNVLAIGETPSPVNYFTVCTQNAAGSIQITASHNPPEDNGLKLQLRNAHAFAGDDLQRLRERIEHREFLDGDGSVTVFDALAPYKEALVHPFQDIGKDMSIVIDGGNGIAGPTASQVLREIGADIHELYIEPDGTFPNHPADPSKHTTLKELQEMVKKEKATLGFAFDGDGDRLGVVDDKGAIVTADQILLLLAIDHLSRHPNAPIVFTVSNSSILETEIKRFKGKPIMCKVGHSFVEHTMREYDALLGGEQSGHFFIGDEYYGFDDALITALHVARIVKNAHRPLSQLIAEFPTVYQAPEMRPHCADEKKGGVIAAATKHFASRYPVHTLDGARIDFGNGAWAGIRQSNTSPCLSICIEARTPEELKNVTTIVMDHMKTYPDVTFEGDPQRHH
jgi:phosphomannomutase/phosphoglucomutase